jgi:P pilus assembly chaperone PapD
MRLHVFAIAAVASMLAIGSPNAVRAMDVSPMVAKITPSGSGSSYRLTVRNDSSSAATVEIEVYRMTVDEAGGRSLTAEDNDIVVFPVQSVIPPNREQVVQVRYLGEADGEGRMYLVRAAQLPINMQTVTDDGAAGADIKVAFTINTYVFVAPTNARAAVEVTSVSRSANGDVLLSARNTGTGFAHLREARFTLRTADGRSHEVPAAAVDVGEVSVIAGGATRQIRIPAALTAGVTGDVTAAIAL